MGQTPPPLHFFITFLMGYLKATFNGCLIFPLHFRVRWQWGPSLAAPGQKCNFWKVLGLARNPSKKMRLDESFRMVQSACHLVAYIKSYGQKTKFITRQHFAYLRNCNGWLCDASRQLFRTSLRRQISPMGWEMTSEFYS